MKLHKDNLEVAALDLVVNTQAWERVLDTAAASWRGTQFGFLLRSSRERYK